MSVFHDYQVFRAPITPTGVKSDIPGKYSRAWTRGPILAQFPQPKKYTQNPPLSQYLSTNKLLVSAAMSHSHPTASSSSNFQLIINNALKAYEKRTKEDLLAHPLAAQLQACNSPGDILAILQQQVQPDQSLPSDDRWSKWLNPTVSVLYALPRHLERVFPS